jgi:hypothetical protein
MRGNNQDVIRILEGRARSARELALLIQAYRDIGNSRAACRNMTVYTERFPTAPQTNNYRQFLARQCR